MTTINQSSSSLNILDRLTREKEDEDKKVASGKRINSAADDAAGLQISSRLTSQINEVSQRSINAQDQVNVNNVQSGQLASISESLQRANTLSIQSGSPLADSNAIQGELDQLTEQINTIAGEALGAPNFVSGLDASDPQATQAALETALTSINDSAAALGADSNALESQVATYETSRVNVSESRSQIEDTDFAKTTAEQQQLNTLIQSTIVNKKDEDQRKGLLVNQIV
jgi:flagellin